MTASVMSPWPLHSGRIQKPRLLPSLRELVTDGLIEAQDTVILQAAVGTGQ